MKHKLAYLALVMGLILGIVLASAGFYFFQNSSKDTTPAKVKIGNQIDAPLLRGKKDAPIKIVEYADFNCPYCKQASAVMKQVLEKYPEAVQVEFRHFPLSSKHGEGSFLVHQAARCAEKQGKFWEFHDAVFALEKSPDHAQIMQMILELRLNPAVFQSCLESHEDDLYLLRSKEDGRTRGVMGTPSYFVNEYFIRGAQTFEFFDQLIGYIQNPADRLPPPEIESAEKKSENYRHQNLEKGQYQGADDAVISLVEFSDYHCPFCKKAAPVLNALMEKYPGKIKRYFRHFPLDFHVGAKDSHQAVECAGEQGKFWEYHQALMMNTATLRGKDAFLKLAVDLGLTHQDFESCWDSQKYHARIEEDIAAGAAANVRGTPTVFINGHLISGARPLEFYEQIIDRELNQENK